MKTSLSFIKNIGKDVKMAEEASLDDLGLSGVGIFDFFFCSDILNIFLCILELLMLILEVRQNDYGEFRINPPEKTSEFGPRIIETAILELLINNQSSNSPGSKQS